MTVPEIAQWRRVDVATVRQDRQRFRDVWPARVGSRRSGGRGRPELEYDAAEIKRMYLQVRPVAARRAADRDPAGGWDLDEIVDAETAAGRLKVRPNTFRMYPAVYAGTANPFPSEVPGGGWRWRDLASWKRNCPGSGRRGQGTAQDRNLAAETA